MKLTDDEHFCDHPIWHTTAAAYIWEKTCQVCGHKEYGPLHRSNPNYEENKKHFGIMNREKR